jgi:hypothetical protein
MVMMTMLTLGKRALICKTGESAPERTKVYKSIEIRENTKTCVNSCGEPGLSSDTILLFHLLTPITAF